MKKIYFYAGTVGLHKQPVVILDFASLYPSIYRAYNLCYSTLLHPDDVKTLNPNDYIVTPTGSFFVKPEVRPGILPSILAALMSARAATRQQLKSATSPGQRAVLDSRQKALKVTANALYGFTGAQASPLQCTQLANACLAYGAQSCKKAKHVLEDLATKGELGTCGEKARVIYGHTDSLFALLPNANSVSEAVRVGHRAAELVSHTFPPPMQLKFERVCQPLMLLHVNRYAGRAFEKETEDESKEGELIVKGLRSMWRQTAPFLRFLINGVLVRVIMGNDVSGAVKFAETEIQRLLRGQVTIYELIMTGGLWRVTGEQVERAATESMESTEEGPAAASSRGVEQKEDIRGPHAALAVRLSQRDPGRSFVLGERLQYVLISGHELQDEAAEDPLEAALCGKSPDYELYWKNKLQRPLAEIFSTCLSPPQVQSLLHGQHTLMKVDNTRLSGHGPGSLGPSSPYPGKGKSKRRQLGMMEFYSARPKCLGCRRPMGGGGGNGGVTKNAIESVPALCDMCAGIDGKRQEVLLNIVHEAACLESELSAAYSACRSCQSGLAMQPVICHNAECPVTYVKIGDHANLEAVALAFKRLEL